MSQNADTNKHLAYLQRRRYVWFCLLYRPAQIPSKYEAGKRESAVAELDGVLNGMRDAGWLEPNWQRAVQDGRVEKGDTGFATEYLKKALTAADRAVLGL